MATITKNDQRHQAYMLQTIRPRTTLVVLTVDPATTLGRMNEAAAKAVVVLDDDATQFMKSGHLTPAGIIEKLAPTLTECRAKIGRAEDEAARQRHNVTRSMAALIEPEALDSTDAAGAILDAEIRASLRALSAADRGKLVEKIVASPDDDGLAGIADAILRDPFPTDEATTVRKARRERATTDPETAEAWANWEALLGGSEAALVNVASLRAVLSGGLQAIGVARAA